jgi:NAD(P)-dependent dehydrogenase (short-subunit alcohol dehydrogenase family)
MNQRVLVTAGASGIGREIARTFAAKGAKAFVSDIDAAGMTNGAEQEPRTKKHVFILGGGFAGL